MRGTDGVAADARSATRAPGPDHVGGLAQAQATERKNSSATSTTRPTPSSSPSGRMANGSSCCCARTRSTPSRAGRSVTRAGCRRRLGDAGRPCLRKRRVAARSSAAPSGRRSSPRRSRRWSMHRAAGTSSATTAPRTWCTRRSGSISAPMCGSRGRWWMIDRLRFDFSHHGPIEPEAMQADRARGERAHLGEPAGGDARRCAIPTRCSSGAMALFSEKYGDLVRVVFDGRLLHRAVRRHARAEHRAGRASSSSCRRAA